MQQAVQKGLTAYDNVIVLAGRSYVEVAVQVFGAEKVSCPLAGCRGNGEMMGILKEAIRRGSPL